MKTMKWIKIFIVSVLLVLNSSAAASSFPELIQKLERSVVGIGTYSPIDGNLATLEGSGFVIGEGKHVVTNYHVVSRELEVDKVQYRVVYSGRGKSAKIHKVKLLDFDPIFDLAILQLIDDDSHLDSVFKISNGEYRKAGEGVAFIGFPISSVLGLYPAVHRGIIAGISPSASPASSSAQLTSEVIKSLQSSFSVYQLDATAYPGNSGSALFDANSGEVIGIINKVMVQGGKEYALSSPSGITYAIPVKHLRNLATRNNISL